MVWNRRALQFAIEFSLTFAKCTFEYRNSSFLAHARSLVASMEQHFASRILPVRRKKPPSYAHSLLTCRWNRSRFSSRIEHGEINRRDTSQPLASNGGGNRSSKAYRVERTASEKVSSALREWTKCHTYEWKRRCRRNGQSNGVVQKKRRTERVSCRGKGWSKRTKTEIGKRNRHILQYLIYRMEDDLWKKLFRCMFKVDRGWSIVRLSFFQSIETSFRRLKHGCLRE